MTVTFFRFPHIHVKDSEQKSIQVKIKKKIGKYDHWQMLLDKIGGMTWEDIAIKHDVSVKDPKKLVLATKNLVLNSKATLKLTPNQVKNLYLGEK